GLGHRLLRHIERHSVLLFMIPADTNDIQAQYEILLNELEQFNPELTHKQRLLAITTADMLDDELMAEMKETVPAGIPSIFISAVSGYNLMQLKDMLWKTINE